MPNKKDWKTQIATTIEFKTGKSTAKIFLKNILKKYKYVILFHWE